jgi:valyl-tRNA synthetase
MSKSVGNVIDPQKIMDQFGAEPFRLWAATEGNLVQQDFRCSNERIMAAGKSLNKLWNVAKYVSMFERPATRPKELSPLDQWILNEIYGIAREANVSFENYDFHNPSIRLRHFLWDTFASHYVELSKNRAYNSAGNFTKGEQESALWTLHECLNILLRLMAPITPFVTAKLYEEIYGADVHAETFPVPEESFQTPFATSELEAMNSTIWKSKKDKGLSLKDEVIMAVVNEKFRVIQHDLIHAHTIRKLDYGEFALDLPATPAPKAEKLAAPK